MRPLLLISFAPSITPDEVSRMVILRRKAAGTTGWLAASSAVMPVIPADAAGVVVDSRVPGDHDPGSQDHQRQHRG